MEDRTAEDLTRDSYTVGWICALDVELAASMAMLDNELPRLPQAEGDSNTYILGRIGQHNIVLTCLPSGTTGTNAAANAATNMMRSFPNIRFCLMVGIGGGAPRAPSDDPCEDIRLGDVVVSCPSINSGGVLQYDFGKTMSEGRFVQTGVLNKPSVVLSNSVSTLRARHRKEKSSISQYISHMLGSNEKMKRHFSHPGLEHDQLFRADYAHLSGRIDCQSCDKEALVLRKSRKDTDPIIHYGLIGSANLVMKDGVTRDKLRDENNILCFEMEAAGLMDVFPCLVVRGICDYADSHKNKRWQPYAAAAAAACVKEILFSTPALEVAVKPSFKGETIYQMLQATVHESNLDVLLNVLPLSNYTHHNSAFEPPIDYDNPKFHWVLRNIDFKQWSLEQGSPTLYLTGILPQMYNLYQLSLYVVDWGRAAGYSVLPILCSTMEHEPSMATFLHIFLLSLVYCSSEEQRTPIMRSCFSKLLEKSIVEGYLDWEEERFNEEIFLKYMKIILKSATTKDLLIWLKIALDFEMQRRLLVVIDGLDVIESVDEHLDCVIPLIKYLQQVPNTKILLTSPARSKAMDIFQDFLHIECDKERKECLKSLQFDNTRYYKISKEHEGSFEWIWTHNAYESWSASDTSKLLYIQGKPGSGKSTLTKYFNRNVLGKELCAREAIVARFFYSFREGELQKSHYNMLLSILYDILQKDEAFFYHRCQAEYRAHQRYGPRFKWDYDSLKTILKSLQDYVTTKRFYLIIDAVDESEEKDRREILGLFLELCSKMKHSVVKVFMASRPVTQLEARRDQLHNVIKLDDETGLDIYNYAHSQLYGLTSTTLLEQTTAYMLENAQGVFLWVRLISERLIEAHEQGYSEEEIFELLKQLPTELEDFYDHMLEKMKQNRSSVVYAAKIFRFILFARRPLTVDEVLHALGLSDSFDSDPNFIPCDISFERCIPSSERIILSSGGNFLEIKEHNGNKTVQFMHQTVREFFLNPNGPVAKSDFWVPETRAHASIAITCVRYLSICAESTSLVGKLPKIGSWDETHYQSYCRYLNGRPLASYALNYVKPHIDSCKSENDVANATSRFTENLNNDPGAALLKRWARSELRLDSLRSSSTQDTAAMSFRDEVLRITSIHGFIIAAKVALLAITNIDNQDEDGRTPLSLAAGNGHEAIVKLLLDKGASIDLSDNNGQTSLSWAATNGHRDIVECLSEYGASIDERDIDYRSPLSWAAEHGHLSIVRFLAEKGATIQYGDNFHKLPLSWAAENGHLAIVKFLFEKGVSLQGEDDYGRTPLSWAAENGNLAIVEFLVEKGADVNVWGRFGRTPLSWAAEHGHLPVVRFLVEKGADVEYSDHFRKQPLSLAVEKGHLDVIKFLVKKGVNIEMKRGNGKMLVSIAVENKRLDIVKFLIEMC